MFLFIIFFAVAPPPKKDIVTKRMAESSNTESVHEKYGKTILGIWKWIIWARVSTIAISVNPSPLWQLITTRTAFLETVLSLSTMQTPCELTKPDE